MCRLLYVPIILILNPSNKSHIFDECDIHIRKYKNKVVDQKIKNLISPTSWFVSVHRCIMGPVTLLHISVKTRVHSVYILDRLVSEYVGRKNKLFFNSNDLYYKDLSKHKK